MKLDDVNEDELIGGPVEDAPTVDPGEHCNGRKIDKGNAEDGFHSLETIEPTFAGYCNQPAGWGTPDREGRCKFHAGLSTGPKTEEGLANIREAQSTHSLAADPFGYDTDLDPAEREFVQGFQGEIIERKKMMFGQVDFIDRVLAKRIAIRAHIAMKASEYVESEGLIETIWTEDGQISMQNRIMDELRRYDKTIVDDLRKLGLLQDPESKKAAAIDRWRQAMESE